MKRTYIVFEFNPIRGELREEIIKEVGLDSIWWPHGVGYYTQAHVPDKHYEHVKRVLNAKGITWEEHPLTELYNSFFDYE